MRDLQTVKENVMPLVNEDGELTRNDQEAAELLASYFEEVFTREDTTNVPIVQERDLNWDDTRFIFKPDDVLKRLHKLQEDKFPGPEGCTHTS